ncbi:MAG TPA: rhodanese-like domain-containing protein [Ilumatobacteraceae bacterium]|nr:rhodanese-like domain-containing protein [Ilumatobacteraceae bacterium]
MSKRVDAQRAVRLLRRRVQLVDVLPSSVYAEEHLPGAVNVPLETLDETSVADLDRDRPVLIYCFDQH